MSDRHDPSEHAATPTPGPSPSGEPDASLPDELGAARRYARVLAGFVLFVGIAAALGGVVLVAYQLTQAGGHVTVILSDPSASVSVDSAGLPAGSTIDLERSLDEVDLHVEELPPALRAVTRSAQLVAGVLWLVAAVLLRRALLEIALGRPFAAIVPRRLAALAVSVVALAVVPQSVDTLVTVIVLDHLGHDGAGSAIGFTIFSIDVVPLLVAAVIGVVASVFRHGRRLSDDLDGLV